MKDEFQNALERIASTQCLSGSDVITLSQLGGDRFWKALQAVASDLVKKYIFEPSGREAWIVVGKSRDYRVLSKVYCDCEDFYINVIVKRDADLCYHIFAKILAEALGVFSEIRIDDMMFETLRREWETLDEPRPPRKKNRSVE
jgi:predicted nucleic acid-binding Zn finger protein